MQSYMHIYTYMCVWNQKQKSVTKCSINESIVFREQAARPGFECQVSYVKVAWTGRLWTDLVSIHPSIWPTAVIFPMWTRHSIVTANLMFSPNAVTRMPFVYQGQCNVFTKYGHTRSTVRCTWHSRDFIRTRITVFPLIAHEQQVGEVCVPTSIL